MIKKQRDKVSKKIKPWLENNGAPVGIALIILLIILSLFLPKDFPQQTKKTEEMEKEKISKLIEYWEKIVVEKPDYRDGYLQLAILHYKLYENDKAQEYLQKTLELDPNFEPAKKMERILE